MTRNEWPEIQQKAKGGTRRLKIAYLGYEWLPKALAWGHGELLEFPRLESTGLPPDVEVVSVHCDYNRNGFVVVLRHDSFDVVPEGEMLSCCGETLRVEWDVLEKQPDGSYRKAE